MTDRREPPVQFRPGPLAPALDARGDNRNEVAARDLGRYYAILSRTLETVTLSEAEWNLLRDALNGTYVDEWWTGNELAAEIADALADGMGQKWGLDARDGARLIDTLRRLSAAETFAIIDAVERWWQRQR